MKKVFAVFLMSLFLIAFAEVSYSQEAITRSIQNAYVERYNAERFLAQKPLNDLVTVLDYMVTLIFDFGVGDLTYNTKTVYDYNEYGDESVALMYRYEVETWIEDSKVVTEYDGNRNVISETTMKYQNGEWFYSNRSLYEYVPGTDNVKVAYEQKYENNEWVYATKIEYFYDDNGNQLYYIMYNYAENNFVPTDKIVFTYEGELITREDIYAYNEMMATWVLKDYRTISYNEDENPVLVISYTFDEELQDFIYHSKVEYTYDNNGNLSVIDMYDWYPDLEDWNLGGKIRYTYNAEGYVTEEVISFNFGEGLLDFLKFLYYYKQIAGVEELSGLAENIMVYPNPVVDMAYLQLDEQATSNLVINIYDNNGKIVRTITQNAFAGNLLELDLRGLSAGNYYISVHSGKLNKVVKIIKN